MAPQKAVNPPATLPANFFENSGPPDTLPSDFDFGDKKPFAPKIAPGEHGMGTLHDTISEAGKSLAGVVKGVGGILKDGPEGAMQNLTRAFVEPSVQEWNTPPQKGVMIGGTGHPTLDRAMRSVPVFGPMTANADRINQEEGFGPAVANLLAPVAAGEAGGGLLKAFAAPATRIGLGLGNDALGATGPKAFKYGQDAARGAYEEGALPALTKHGAAMNVEEVLPKAGKKISNAVFSSPNSVPLRDIAESIEKPLQEGRSIVQGPGGGNRSTAPIDALQESMHAPAPKASAPIYGPSAGNQLPSNFSAIATSPEDVWRTIQNVDKNTRFNPDPEVEGVNELRRSVRGGLRGNLEDAVPGLKPLTQRYADLKQAQESLDRTMHGGIDIGHMLDAAKFPIQTTVGRGLYTAGKAARPMSSVFSKAFPAVYAATQRKDQ